MADLTDSVILVTGASGLIGSAVCAALAQEGATVVAQFHRRPSTAPSRMTVQADLTDEAQVGSMFDRIRSTVGPLDGCVAAAAVWPQHRTVVVDMPTAEWHQYFTANALMTFLTARGYLGEVRSRGAGSLVLLGAASATYGHPGRAHFAAGKSAVTFGLLQTLVDEMTALAARGRVNVVAPGSVPANGPPTEIDLGEAERAAAALPDAPTADDVAQAIVWLLSARTAGSITGQVIRVDAGLSGRLRRKPSDTAALSSARRAGA